MARVLVVDDDSGVRSFLADALELGGHDVEQAADGAAGLLALRRAAFDLVLTDLKMPGVDGLELLATVRREQPEVEVILLTAHGSIDVAVRAMKQGAFDFLQKPLSGPGELRQVVARALERRQLRARAEVSRLGSEALPLTYGAASMAQPMRALERVARTDSTVLLLGESGTGKELAARYVHEHSSRSEGPFVAVNCAALTESLLESELFGHEKGSFTGATVRKRGRIELAAGGTFFLDEVGELAPRLQAALLRVLQERVFTRVGGGQSVQADVRWVAATNRDLEREVEQSRFREDLYFRLAVFPVVLPPLRDRLEDLEPLSQALLRRIGGVVGRSDLLLGPEALAVLRTRAWRGNVRELANTLERAAILAEGPVIGPGDLGLVPRASPAVVRTLQDLELEAIRAALERHSGHRQKAAEELGIGLRTLYDKLRKHDLG